MPYLEFRQKQFTGDGSIMSWTVPFQARSEDDIYVYESRYEGDNPVLMVKNVDYRFMGTGVGIPTDPLVAEEMTVDTLDDTYNLATYTVIRVSSRTQPKNFNNAIDGNDLEYETRSVSYQTQETIVATLESFQADGSRIHTLAAPIEDRDMATQMYMQTRYSLGGGVPPPTSTDVGKCLVAASANDISGEVRSTVYWKNPIGAGRGGSNKVMRVNSRGIPYEAPAPDYAPTLPSVPSHLSTNAANDDIEWRVVSDLPDPSRVPDYHAIISQEGGTVAWEDVDDLPPAPIEELPHADKYYILTLWSGLRASETVTDYTFTKDTYIQSSTPTTNYGDTTVLKTVVAASSSTHTLLEMDVSSLDLNLASVVKVELSLHKSNSQAGTDAHTFIVGRLNQDWVEDEATWEEASDGVAWGGGDGAINNIDYDIHCYPFLTKGVGTDPAGVRHEFDITYLLHDAINNRDGKLSLLVFTKTFGTTVWTNWISNDHATSSQHPKLKITTSTPGRSAKWVSTAWGTANFGPVAIDGMGPQDVFFNTPDSAFPDLPYGHGGDGEHGLDQEHWHGFTSQHIMHYMNLPDIKGIAYVQHSEHTTDTVGTEGETEYYEASIDTQTYTDRAIIYLFHHGKFFRVLPSLTGNTINQTKVAWMVWSPTIDRSLAPEGGECG